MLSPGTLAPDFTLLDDHERRCSLSAQLRQGPLVLYFYPADFTPGCTREACAVRDMHGELVAAGLTVWGVSPQSVESHQRFRERYQLPFPLLADTEREVIRAYDCEGILGLLVQRTTYLIRPDRTIAAGVVKNFGVSDHVSFFRQAIELQKSA